MGTHTFQVTSVRGHSQTDPTQSEEIYWPDKFATKLFFLSNLNKTRLYTPVLPLYNCRKRIWKTTPTSILLRSFKKNQKHCSINQWTKPPGRGPCSTVYGTVGTGQQWKNHNKCLKTSGFSPPHLYHFWGKIHPLLLKVAKLKPPKLAKLRASEETEEESSSSKQKKAAFKR